MICHKNIPSYYLPYFNAFSSKLTKISMLSMVIIDLYFTWASYSSSSMVALPGTVAMVLFWMKSFSLLISSLTRLFNCSLLHRKRKRFSIAFHCTQYIIHVHVIAPQNSDIYSFEVIASLKDIPIPILSGEDVDSEIKDIKLQISIHLLSLYLLISWLI